MAKVARALQCFNDPERNNPAIKSCDPTYPDLEVENVSKKKKFFLKIISP